MLADRLELAGAAAGSRYRVEGCVGDPGSCGVVLDTWFMLLLG
jgi:hypothetical protein